MNFFNENREIYFKWGRLFRVTISFRFATGRSLATARDDKALSSHRWVEWRAGSARSPFHPPYPNKSSVIPNVSEESPSLMTKTFKEYQIPYFTHTSVKNWFKKLMFFSFEA